MPISTLSRVLVAAVLISAVASPALAVKGGSHYSNKGHYSWDENDHGNDNDHRDWNDSRDNDRNDWRDRSDDHEHRDNRAMISSSDRKVVRDYLAWDYRNRCPHGLAKKHNRCKPPGHVKNRYVIGRPLPRVVVYEQVPRQVLMQLQPVPSGYQYVRVDNDVLLISQASHNVIDAITLLSAVGQ